MSSQLINIATNMRSENFGQKTRPRLSAQIAEFMAFTARLWKRQSSMLLNATLTCILCEVYPRFLTYCGTDTNCYTDVGAS